jgi:hypothetical protein
VNYLLADLVVRGAACKGFVTGEDRQKYNNLSVPMLNVT